MNVFTADALTPLSNEVISWGWRDYTQTEDTQRAKLRRETTESLRRFRNGPRIAAAYVDAKVLLSRKGGLAPLRAAQWAVNAVRHADRVLLGAPPCGVDRRLWATAYVTG